MNQNIISPEELDIRHADMLRDEITVTFPSGRQAFFPRGTKLIDVCEDNEEFKHENGYPLLGALADKELVSLNEHMTINCSVEPLFGDSDLGSSMYRESVAFLLSMAAHKLWHMDNAIVISHSLGHGYFYHYKDENKEMSDENLRELEAKMHELVADALNISRRQFAYDQALDYFRQTNQDQSASLIEARNDPRISLLVCSDFLDLWHHALVHNTAVLKTFSLMKYGHGFILRFPSRKDPLNLPAFVDNQNLYQVYKEHTKWGKTLGIQCVGDLNRAISTSNIREFICTSEAIQQANLARLAMSVPDTAKLLLIAGPSSSGKSTFALRLAIQLRALGRRPVTIGLDNYYVDREMTPKDEDGNFDFEAVEAIDIDYLNSQLTDLMAGEEIRLPRFDFVHGKRTPGNLLKLPPSGIIIMEGIHGLNDRLTSRVPAEDKYKVFISPLTMLNIDDHTRISTTENRLIRRMVRDYQFRGCKAATTLAMWPSVRRGEETHIFPYQNKADFVFNSTLDYELSALSVHAIGLLRGIKPGEEGFPLARKLLKFLRNFHQIDARYVPKDSLLREFLGGGSFDVH
ncbi:uridine kinase [Carpediemonas membranifera]|uniref:Uridine kinase n=1 Tax=Carpediemonas membranifera TaxID=201153 RepID=A0A8J6B652_9EUKA|nr:uridine kinase [Carpediemonas membranifera]|eukprot:KAG9393647.1 uridine kinase [Carpediemonas membranifera]